MNNTLADLKLNQGAEDQLQDHLSPPTMPPARPLQPSDTGLWEAIERLDNMVVNNTVKVGHIATYLCLQMKHFPGLKPLLGTTLIKTDRK